MVMIVDWQTKRVVWGCEVEQHPVVCNCEILEEFTEMEMKVRTPFFKDSCLEGKFGFNDKTSFTVEKGFTRRGLSKNP